MTTSERATAMATLDLSALTDDGDTIDLADGRRLRLRIEPDMDTTFDDFDCYGQVAAGRRNRDTGRGERPEGFDGNAEKLSNYGDGCWWQPPRGENEVKRTDPGFKEFREIVRELASFGWKIVTLEVLDGKDAYGRPIVVEATSLGGVDDATGEYLASVIEDMIGELSIG